MKIKCKSDIQKTIICCLLKYDSLNIYELMKLTEISKTTIIDNIRKLHKLIYSFRKHSDKRGRPITYFYISKDIRINSNINVIIDNSLILEVKKWIKPKIQYKVKKNKRDNPTNCIKRIRKPKAYILPKKNYKSKIKYKLKNNKKPKSINHIKTIKILNLYILFKENYVIEKPVYKKFINEV